MVKPQKYNHPVFQNGGHFSVIDLMDGLSTVMDLPPEMVLLPLEAALSSRPRESVVVRTEDTRKFFICMLNVISYVKLYAQSCGTPEKTSPFRIADSLNNQKELVLSVVHLHNLDSINFVYISEIQMGFIGLLEPPDAHPFRFLVDLVFPDPGQYVHDFSGVTREDVLTALKGALL